MSVPAAARGLRSVWIPVGALGLTAALSALLLAAGGHDVGRAFAALWSGAFGSWDRFASITLVRATPLIITGLAVAFAFRAGVWNIGAEGQLYAGAMVAAWLGLQLTLPSPLMIPVLIGAAAIAGSAWAWVPALLKTRAGVSEVITTLLMNFVAIHMASALVRGPLQESRGVFPQTDSIAVSAHLPLLWPGTRLHLGFALGLLMALGVGLLLARTPFGFRVQAVGAAPQAARVSGRISPAKVLVATLLLSGGLAGVAGGVEVMGVTWALYENLSPGYGYTAIAVALLGGLHPLGVVLAGIGFGALEAGASQMQRTAAVPAVWASAIEALAILCLVVVDRWARRTGAA